jgi:hypothetical protein
MMDKVQNPRNSVKVYFHSFPVNDNNALHAPVLYMKFVSLPVCHVSIADKLPDF